MIYRGYPTVRTAVDQLGISLPALDCVLNSTLVGGMAVNCKFLEQLGTDPSAWGPCKMVLCDMLFSPFFLGGGVRCMEPYLNN